MNARTQVSPNGDVPIPQDVRDRLAWEPGTALELVETPEGVTLRRTAATSDFAPKSLSDLDALPGAAAAQPVEAISRLSDDDIRSLAR